MLSRDKHIVCDYCTKEQYGIFIYYSLEYGKITVNTTKKYTTQWRKDLEFDMCSKCFDRLKSHIIAIPSRPEVNLKLNCDTCHDVMCGDFNYYYIKIDKVEIDSTGKAPLMKSHVKDYLSLRMCVNCFSNIDKLLKENKLIIAENISKKGNWS